MENTIEFAPYEPGIDQSRTTVQLLSWSDVNKAVDALARNLEPLIADCRIKSVHGFARGGLIVAVMLSHKLEIPVISMGSAMTLYIDDIYDTGKTMETLQEPRAVLITKTKDIAPIFWGAVVPGAHWIVFPWETEDSSRQSNEDLMNLRYPETPR